MIRGYTIGMYINLLFNLISYRLQLCILQSKMYIGWGKGIPDVYTKLVEGKRRLYIIEDLQPNSDYVISVRAFNQVGDGEPIYVNERTKSTSDEEFGGGPMMAQLPPPIGLRAVILSSTSAVLYWTDSSLSRTQLATDNRYYVVRFLPTEQSSALGPKKTSPKLVNTTQMNTILDDLRPGMTIIILLS